MKIHVLKAMAFKENAFLPCSWVIEYDYSNAFQSKVSLPLSICLSTYKLYNDPFHQHWIKMKYQNCFYKIDQYDQRTKRFSTRLIFWLMICYSYIASTYTHAPLEKDIVQLFHTKICIPLVQYSHCSEIPFSKSLYLFLTISSK